MNIFNRKKTDKKTDDGWFIPKSHKKYKNKNKQSVINRWNELAANGENLHWPVLIAELIEAYLKP